MKTNMITNFLTSETNANFAKGVKGAVLFTTGIKAIGRPAFIMIDKKSDPETKKYTAEKEFLYQAICMGIALAFIPFFSVGGYKLAGKYLKGSKVLEDAAKNVSNTKFFKKIEQFKTEFKNIKHGTDEAAKESMTKANGIIELSSLIGSIIGLTLVAPEISHKTLHPVMNALGLDKKPKDIGQPKEIFLADAKVPTEKAGKVNTVV